jgi:hypothetical protein
MKRFWHVLKYLDCWVTDKWTGRDWEYYSAVLGKKEQSGRLSWNQKWIARMLNYLEEDHCKKAIKAKPPRK